MSELKDGVSRRLKTSSSLVVPVYELMHTQGVILQPMHETSVEEASCHTGTGTQNSHRSKKATGTKRKRNTKTVSLA